jgi:hypothetical protein
MKGIKDDLEAWRARSTYTTDGVAGEVGVGGLVGEMRREVLLIAVTPTQQEMKSSVGREVSDTRTSYREFDAHRQVWFCALHAIHHFSMLRTIAVHELVNCSVFRSHAHADVQGLKLPVEFGTAPSTLL